MNKIRVRFAPSPTGYLHIGGLRSALYNYLFAKKNNGTFILRIEDTDQKRHVKKSVENLIKSLQWAGLDYDEGTYLKNSKFQIPNSKFIESKNYPGIAEIGEYGPYIQSERLDIYQKYAEQLVKEEKAYYCFCTPERLDQMRKDQIAAKQAPMYDKYCLKNLTQEEINKNLKNNCPRTIRLKIDPGETLEFSDIIRGAVKFETGTIDDQVLLKSDGYPTYHLAGVVDDHLMKITHVIRGEEWLPSTPKHILLYQTFGWEPPKFAHLPLLLNPDRTKLSKRQGDVSVEDYIQKGYLREAIINFVALLGWNPGKGSTKEFFSLNELVKEFELKKVHKAGAIFDLKKLDWINSQYIKKLTISELYQESLEFFKRKDFYNNALPEKKSEEYLRKVLAVEQERLANLAGVGENDRFFFEDVEYDKELLRWKNMSDEELKNSLEKSKNISENISEADWTKENLEKILLEAAGEKRGELLWPLRVSLTGEKKSPPPFEIAWVLGKDETLKRLKQAIDIL
ncbi:MAG: glutamate--tRNA ligase [Candidatus Moranbacteria bacterium]|nr:glutamate--tRNA ligase [Candidatus Moranbacteria bacterium]